MKSLTFMHVLSVIAIVVGAFFLGAAFGAKVGIGIGLIAWGLKG